MAKRAEPKAADGAEVESYKHKEARRKNIPTAELQKLVPGDDTATAPVLAAEVLSPSTAAIDLGDKAAEYLRLPSLAAYLVFAHDEVKAWAFMRAEHGFPPAPT